MGLQLKLNWFEKETEEFTGKEYSQDLGDDVSVIERLDLSVEEDINNGEFEVKQGFASVLQPYFKHEIEINKFDYFVAFNYQKNKW
ncbi:colicin E3-like toxin immunity protein [Erwinia pyri]|uniref:Colicin E3-like toxin immunity protein n=1 Tax=Erwinia pyri TaxID=3062598 RepID=A0AA50HPS1_9GAMM|nr:colicin E3-like toxin immunity protein [Erwinia sp. DE2]WLS80557.1 colicin E3-like toxin immunity protein [Erwinia sp. DE2]